MSKDEKEKLGPNSPKKIDVQHTAEVTETLSKGITALVPMTKTQKGLKVILADEHARTVLCNTMSAFVHIDQRFESGMQSMGNILSNLLSMPEDIQKKAIAAICTAQGMDPIEETGRKGFAMALFAKYPEMLVLSGKNKDTRAGMRITSYLAAYKNTMAPKRLTGRKPNGAGNGETVTNSNPKSAKELFITLYLGGTTREQANLVNLAGRCGIAYEDWVDEATGDDEEDDKGKK